MTDAVIGIDVGTGSARAGVFDLSGRLLGQASRDIRMWKPEADFVEQSSDDIWAAIRDSVRRAVEEAGVRPDDVKGLGFDATCSLVVLDASGRPVTVSPSGDDAQNVIVWMDHRAIPQAERINGGGHAVLHYVGGIISPEMETPKLLWLKEHMPQTWSRAAHFFDLPDFLTWRATGAISRSLCSTVCKWTYLGHEGRWDPEYFRAIGLGDLADEGFARLGTDVKPMGTPVGHGLSAEAAFELGLARGTPVGASIIDAHAGGLGMIGTTLDGRKPGAADLNRRLALIGGTSSCHMAVSVEPSFVPGVWGPYYSAMVPGLWLNEGGQSATGALVDHVIRTHARGIEAEAAAKAKGRTVYELLNERLAALAEGRRFPAAVAGGRHVLPYFHGNRSPRADPTLRGIVSGLSLADTLDDLAVTYLATIQGIAHGTRHIVDALNAQGYRIDTILACGGGTKNPVFLREHADATGCRIVLPKEPEAVLLGSAILGAVAAKRFASAIGAMGAMTRAERIIEPAGSDVANFHTAKHDVFRRMYDDQMAYRQLMDGKA
jgi:FGGY-family pentulose kinase